MMRLYNIGCEKYRARAIEDTHFARNAQRSTWRGSFILSDAGRYFLSVKNIISRPCLLWSVRDEPQFLVYRICYELKKLEIATPLHNPWVGGSGNLIVVHDDDVPSPPPPSVRRGDDALPLTLTPTLTLTLNLFLLLFTRKNDST